MIAKARTGKGFGGLARYLEKGSKGEEADRVEWRDARNLPTSDPQLAARMMRATANLNHNVEKPVYHLSISFDPGDNPSPEVMRQVADQTVKDLGLGDHQALVIAHTDTAHKHVHIMVNRVHPETGKAWDNGQDFARLEKSLRIQERALGLREVPGHHHRLEGQQEPDRTAPTTGQLRQAERSGEKSFDERVRAVAGAAFKEAKDWGDLAQRLDRHGLRLEKRGRGMVVTDGKNIAKGSSIDRNASLANLEKRLGGFDRNAVRIEREERGRSGPEAVAPSVSLEQAERQIQALARGFQKFNDLNASLESTRSEVALAAEEAKRIQWQGNGQVRQKSEAFDKTLKEIYRNPAEARRRFDALVDKEGTVKSVEAVRDNPEVLGALKGRQVLWMVDEERKGAIEKASQLGDKARDFNAAKLDGVAAFSRLQAATDRLLSAKARLQQLEERQRDEVPKGMTVEYFRAGFRANLLALGAQEAAKLAVKIGKELGAECAREVSAAIRDVWRGREDDKERKPKIEL